MIACTTVVDAHDESSVFLRRLLRVMWQHFRPLETVPNSILDLSLIKHKRQLGCLVAHTICFLHDKLLIRLA